MTNDLTIFKFETSDIRVVTDDVGVTWFNANDVCSALELGNPRQVLESHVESEDVQKMYTLTSGGSQLQNHINESGLYAIIFGSRKEAAKRFKHWVTSEVLPSIRKTGTYSVPQDANSRSVSVIRAKLSVAELFECPKHLAQIEAVKAALAETGIDHSSMLSIAPAQSNIPDNEVMLEPTEIGRHLNPQISARTVNKRLCDAGLQVKTDHGFEATHSGQKMSTRHAWKRWNKTGYNLKWKLSAVKSILTK